MSTQLGPLYHWSPRERLKSIKRLGLVPGKRSIRGPVWHGNPTNLNIDDNEDIGEGEYLQPSVSFCPSPAMAWAYSNGFWQHPGMWDLWEVRLTDQDEVHIRAQWGAGLVEIRVHNRILKSRLVWVGERTVT